MPRFIYLFLAVLLATSVRADVATSLQQASALSQQSGKPIFAVYGTRSCPHCVKLFSRLNEDPSLREYGSTFVILKIDPDDPMWATFDRKFSPNARSVPRLYFVSSSGEALKVQSGAPQGDGLVRLFDSVLQQSGPGLPEKTIQQIESLTNPSVLESQPLWAQATAWSQTAAFVSLGNRHSEALQPIVARMEDFFGEVDVAATRSLATVESDPVNEQAVLDAALLMIIAERRTATPETGRSVSMSVTEQLQKNGVDRKLARSSVSHATDLIDATASEGRIAKPAKARLDDVLRSVPVDSPSPLRDRMREAKLSIPESNSAKPPGTVKASGTSVAKTRWWTSADGQFRKSGKLVRRNATHVQIEFPDGTKSAVPISSLSAEDQAFLER